jgi:hypothetical protein
MPEQNLHRSLAAYRPRTPRVWLVLVVASFWLAACGSPEATPTPTATPLPATATATVTPVPIEAIPTTIPATPTIVPVGAGAATPEVSVPAVEEGSNCSVEYDLDLVGYQNLQQRLGCALSKATYDPVAINEFGEGPEYSRFMLWFSQDLEIFVLLPDGTWQAYLDTWADDQPEISCNPLNTSPTSPPLPRRGFGKLWCTVDGLQEQLGLIDREERLCQHTVVQRFEQGRLLACFEDANIRYFRLLDDGTWDMEMMR